MKNEVLANFYANFALIWLAAGFVGPIFSPIENKAVFVVKLISSLIGARMFLQLGLNKVK